MNMPTTEDYIILFYCLIDELLQAEQSTKPGPKPECSDAEVMTLAFIQNLKHIESESEFLRQYQSELKRYVPSLPCQVEYNRRLKENEDILASLMTLMIELNQVEQTPGKAYQDTIPIAVTKYQRRPKGNYHREAMKGYCASKRWYFWGYFLHLAVSPEGIPLQFTLLPADVDETKVLEEAFLDPLRGYEIGTDKGYIVKAEKKAKLWQDLHITLIHPFRQNQLKKNTVREKAFLKKRGVIERVGGWLDGKLRLEETLSKSLAGLSTRIWLKILFFGFCLAFNSMLGNPLLQIAKIWH